MQGGKKYVIESDILKGQDGTRSTCQMWDACAQTHACARKHAMLDTLMIIIRHIINVSDYSNAYRSYLKY